MAQRRAGLALIPEGEQGADIGTGFKSYAHVEGAGSDSDCVSDYSGPDGPVPWNGYDASMKLRNSRGPPEPSEISGATGSSRYNDSSVYGSARSTNASSHYFSAPDSIMSNPERLSSAATGSKRQMETSEDSEYKRLLKQKQMILPDFEELNWADRRPGSGQHVEFGTTEKPPLREICLLGQSPNAEVHKVRCKRIFLARKRMTCGPRFALKDAILEAEHLQRLRHSHIIQLVGSYTKGRTFSILMYPVADYELSQFMGKIEDILTSELAKIEDYMAVISLGNFFSCLTSAVNYIHERNTAHMDIKPRNILVKQHPRYEFSHRVYLADFGISRHFSPLDHSQTDTPISFTRKYCAPEVSDQDSHGRSADIFSLGCVFLEMHTVLCGRTRDDFMAYQSQYSAMEAYYVNHPRVLEWADQLSTAAPVLVLLPMWWTPPPLPKGHRNDRIISKIKEMLNWNAPERPRARELFPSISPSTETCCGGSLETFEMERDDERFTCQDAQNDDSEVEKLGNHVFQTGCTELEMLGMIAISNQTEAILRQLLPMIKNFKFSNEFNPLHYAAAEGDPKIMQLLFDSGICGTSTCVEGSTGALAIYYATRYGQDRVTNQLLKQDSLLPGVCQEALELACDFGDEQVVRSLLSNREIILTEKRQTAVAKAARNGHSRVVEILLQNLEVASSRDKVLKAALFDVVSGSDFLGAQILLDHGAPLDDEFDETYNPLEVAAVSGSSSLFKKLLYRGLRAKSTLQVWTLNTALHQVVMTWVPEPEHFDLVNLLLHEGASLASHDKSGRTPLHTAVLYSSDLVQFLLEKGADIAATSSDGKTVLHFAASAGKRAAVQILLDKGADVEAKDRWRKTALHFAAAAGNLAIVQLLLDKGADIAAKDCKGKTALHIAALWSKATLQILLDKGADVHATDTSGLTPLHVVIDNCLDVSGSDKISKAALLLERGADTEARTLHGETALHFAGQVADASLVKLLLEKGADWGAKTSNGLTPEDVCEAYWGLQKSCLGIFKRHRCMLEGNGSISREGENLKFPQTRTG